MKFIIFTSITILILFNSCKNVSPTYSLKKIDTVYVPEYIEIIKKADTVALPIRITKFVKDTVRFYKLDTIFRYRESQTRIKLDFADSSDIGNFSIFGISDDTTKGIFQKPIIRETSIENVVKDKPDFLDRIENFFYLFLGFAFLFMLFKTIK